MFYIYDTYGNCKNYIYIYIICKRSVVITNTSHILKLYKINNFLAIKALLAILSFSIIACYFCDKILLENFRNVFVRA